MLYNIKIFLVSILAVSSLNSYAGGDGDGMKAFWCGDDLVKFRVVVQWLPVYAGVYKITFKDDDYSNYIPGGNTTGYIGGYATGSAGSAITLKSTEAFEKDFGKVEIILHQDRRRATITARGISTELNARTVDCHP